MRASRLVSILLLLQARGRMTADELAEELEVSVRTIYRDATSLQIAGVPLVSESGHDGGYELSGGYRTNLTGFTTDEAAALFLAGTPGLASELGMGDAASTVRHKLVAALPAEQRQSATRMSRSFHLDAPGWFQHFDRPPHLATVTDAVLAQRCIRVLYCSWERESIKMLDPYGLVQKGGRWYLVAASTGRAGRPSTYRVDQIGEITVLDDTFTRPDDFDLATFWNESLLSFRDRMRTGTALVKFNEHGVERFRELTSETAEVTGEEVDGWVTATIPIESIGDAHHLLWRLGADVEVLEPIELRSRLRDAAHELADLYRLTA
jgi:predicted DNA-binding transcriptional regulator YafY